MSAMSHSAGAPRPTGPLSIRERRRSNPGRGTRAAVLVAVAVLPAGQRDRYSREFFAELHDVARSHRLRHALGFLAHAWSLRLALRDTDPTPSGALTMRKSLRCTLFLHHDVLRHNGEVQPPEKYWQCTRCGRLRNVSRITPTGAGAGAGAS